MIKALVLVSPGVFDYCEREMRTPASGEAVLDVVATGICGSDVHGAAGHTGRREVGQVMGHETVGRVVEIGPDVDEAFLGRVAAVDPVMSCDGCPNCRSGAQQHCENGWVLGVRADYDGAYADRLVLPARNLVLLPDEMTAWHGALIEPLAVGFHAAVRGNASPLDRVLILGGGPIGQAVALGCRRLGVREIVVSEPDLQRGALIESLGFTHITPDLLDQDAEGERAGWASLVFDVVGTDRTLASALQCSARMARIVLVGMDAPTISLSSYAVSAGERAIIGTISSTRRDYMETADWVAANPSVVEAMVDAHEALEDGPQVFERLLGGVSRANKVLLHPNL